MPRPSSRVKSFGAVDLHFHGAFGIDLMTADTEKLNVLSDRLWRKGIAAFSATTLSSSEIELETAVRRLGAWIRSGSAPGARPLGIHLEGPFLASGAVGAHPPSALRPLTLEELNHLWEVSQETLQILTLAPESLTPPLLTKLTSWAAERRIRLSIGHSRCTEAQAHQAFDAGFTGVTHAWNALAYHHREAGALGAAFGRKNVEIELIPDGVHLSDTVIDWTLDLHPQGSFFVSDAAPAAGTDGKDFHDFGGIRCRFEGNASRLPDGSLAGGGLLLSEAFQDWVMRSATRKGKTPLQLLRANLHRINELPLQAIFFSSQERRKLLETFPVIWEIAADQKSLSYSVLPKKPEKESILERIQRKVSSQPAKKGSAT